MFKAHKDNWYVAYTVPRCEKLVEMKINDRGINSFLPLKMEEKKWSDRIKKVETPLFPGYLFVCTTPDKIYDLTQIDQLLRFISFNNEFATVKKEEIESIRQLMQNRMALNPEDRVYRLGERVKVVYGPLKGMEGLLVKQNSQSRFVIQIKVLHRSIAVDVPTDYLRPC